MTVSPAVRHFDRCGAWQTLYLLSDVNDDDDDDDDALCRIIRWRMDDVISCERQGAKDTATVHLSPQLFLEEIWASLK